MSFSIDNALKSARKEHEAVLIVAEGKAEARKETLPAEAFQEGEILAASLVNCRCSSDSKAIAQFHRHSRIPSESTAVTLGHETVMRLLRPPKGSSFRPGDLVLVTPGHTNRPYSIEKMAPATEGKLLALGYSYRWFGGLRGYSWVPGRTADVVKSEGFGDLFLPIPSTKNVSLATLAHAEPFACCYGANRHVFTFDAKGDFRYGVPPRVPVAYLGGTSRMAMINLATLAARPDADLPAAVYVTGSAGKLADLERLPLLKDLRRRGVILSLLDRKDPDLKSKLVFHGAPAVVVTNYPSQEMYDLAVEIVAPGGNINNYAGASTDDIGFRVKLQAVPSTSGFSAEATDRLSELHHTEGPIDEKRTKGPRKGGVVAFFDFADDRLAAYLKALPKGHRVFVSLPTQWKLVAEAGHQAVPEGPFDDVFLAGTKDALAARYAQVEAMLARGASVNPVDGEAEIFIRSRRAHYQTRHQVVGPAAPFHFTNTSEPSPVDMRIQGTNPISFDWLVRGVAGLRQAPAMMTEVEKSGAFGTFLTLVEIPDFPWVDVSAPAFREAAKRTSEAQVRKALEAGATALDATEGVWSRAVETAIYEGAGLHHPFDL